MEELKKTAEAPRYETLEVYEGAKFKTTLTRKSRERKPWIPYNPAEVSSFIPGTIRKIFVAEGQQVKKGEKLLILEAMKMMNEITASMDGVVKAVHIKPGIVVTNKQLLIELESVKPGARKSRKERKKK